MTGTLTDRMLRHFDEHRRDMPWRTTSDPYAIWVSEVMLQQTRVDAVIPYYRRWIEQFPTVVSLADASSESVLRAWEGLGYYARARNLQAAARVVCESHNGRLPASARELRTLPGIGSYTAGAVASIAYGQPEPAIDGNARRVFARLFDLEDCSIPNVERVVRDIVPADRPGDFNQAIMELGATICTPHPRCAACPVNDLCAAAANGTVHVRPKPKLKRSPALANVATVVLRDDHGRLLLRRRPDAGLLAGFWQFPAAEVPSTGAATAAARRLASDILGAEPPRARRLPAVTHAFTHRTETYHPMLYDVRLTVAEPGDDMRWVTVAEAANLPVSVAQRTIMRMLQDGPLVAL